MVTIRLPLWQLNQLTGLAVGGIMLLHQEAERRGQSPHPWVVRYTMEAVQAAMERVMQLNGGRQPGPWVPMEPLDYGSPDIPDSFGGFEEGGSDGPG